MVVSGVDIAVKKSKRKTVSIFVERDGSVSALVPSNLSDDEIENILKTNDNLYALKRFMPYCELQLGKRNLYPNINSSHTRENSSDDILKDRKQLNILLYILSYADGKNNILDISNRSGFKLDEVKKVLKICIKKKLIKYY